MYFIDIVRKSKATLEVLVFETINPDLFIEILDPNKIKELAIESLTEKAAEIIPQMSELAKLRLRVIEND